MKRQEKKTKNMKCFLNMLKLFYNHPSQLTLYLHVRTYATSHNRIVQVAGFIVPVSIVEGYIRKFSNTVRLVNLIGHRTNKYLLSSKSYKKIL
jgi:hypothetical protein